MKIPSSDSILVKTYKIVNVRIILPLQGAHINEL